MANPNSSYTNVITSTWDQRAKTVADNISNSNVVLAEFSRKGRVRPFRGGYKIVEPLMHTGPTSSWYSGGEELGTGDTDVLTAAEFNIKQLATNITITGLEKAQNSGPEAHLDLLETKTMAAEASLSNALTSGIYSLGTESDGKTLVGLRLIVADDGTGTVGGIARATYTFWANNFYNGDTTSASNVQTQMNAEYAEVARGGDVPDVILMGSTFWSFYMASLQANQRFVDSKTAALGFPATQYMGANAYLDSTVPTATNCYFINTKYLSLRPHADFQFKALPARGSVSADAENVFVVWYGALTVSNCARQGVIVGA